MQTIYTDYIKSNNGDTPMVTHINLNRTFFSSSSNSSLREIWDGLSEPCSEFPLSALRRNSSTPATDLLSVCSGFNEEGSIYYVYYFVLYLLVTRLYINLVRMRDR